MKPQGHEENCTQTAPTFPRDQPALLVVHAAWLVPARTPLLKPGIIFGWLQSKAEVCFNLSRRVEPSQPPPEGICSNTNLKQLFPCSHFMLRVKLGARCLATRRCLLGAIHSCTWKRKRRQRAALHQFLKPMSCVLARQCKLRSLLGAGGAHRSLGSPPGDLPTTLAFAFSCRQPTQAPSGQSRQDCAQRLLVQQGGEKKGKIKQAHANVLFLRKPV